jgi:hypothetical protein
MVGLALAFGQGVLVGGCAAARPGPEGLLSQAGFQTVPADNPRKVEHLRTLPAHRLVERTKDGRPYYVYADPDHCKCLYVGDASAYAKYQSLTSHPASATPREVIEWELTNCCR